ncbi:MAG: hypothetical protein WC794_02345 [Candidatus Doudnabacteria bacterium]|jgi:hypothetical protein
MPTELKNVTATVMDKIHHDKIKMRSKMYFVFGSFLAFMGLIASMLISVFLVGLLRFSLRSHGPMGEYRLEQILSNFPWWAVVVAILGLFIGAWLLRRYDFSYKFNFKLLVAGFVVAIILAGWVFDMAGLNDILFRQGPMQGIMRQYQQQNNSQPSQWRGGWGNYQK